MTSFVRSESFNGPLEIHTVNTDGEVKRLVYVFQRDSDFHSYIIAVHQISFDTHLIQRSGFYIKGRPVAGEHVEVWADGTDMPVDMARAMLNYLYSEHVFVLDSTEYDQYGGVVSFDFEVVV